MHIELYEISKWKCLLLKIIYNFCFLITIRYLRIFWEQFYQSTTDESENEAQEETTKWSEISKKLTWKNQLERLEYHDRMKFYEEVKQKASAWFHVTYEPWIKYTKRNCSKTKRSRDRFTNNQQAEQQPKQFKGLFSFAWIVYPVLLEIVSEKQGDLENNTESKNKKKKKKKKNKNKDVILPNNNN
jgi:pterin-4a-carbinolamine dehydratase